MSQQEQQPRRSRVDIVLDPSFSDDAFTGAVQRLDAGRQGKLRFIIEARIAELEAQLAASQTPSTGNSNADAQHERLKTILRDQAAPLTQSLTRLEQIFYAFLQETYQDAAAAWRQCHLMLNDQPIQAITGQWQANMAVFGSLKGSGMFGSSGTRWSASDLAAILGALVTARHDRQTLLQLGISQ